MKNIFSTLMIIIIIMLSSCYNKTPETIIGLKLGVDFDSQIKKAIDSNKLKIDPRLPKNPYVMFPNGIRGYLSLFYINHKLSKIYLYLSSPNISKIKQSNANNFYPMEFIITKEDKDYFVSLYERKYGICKRWKKGDPWNEADSYYSSTEINDDERGYTWKKGHLCLELKETFINNEWHIFIIYKLDSNYEKILENEADPTI